MSSQTRSRALGRHDRVLVIAGAVLALSAVVAALVIFGTDDGGTTRAGAARERVEVRDGSLVLGPEQARHQLVVVEDFASARCRAFDLATRDFLRIDAAKGLVRVVYRPAQQLTAPYSASAFQRWTHTAVPGAGGKALALHSTLYDDQPAPTGTEPPGLPQVTLDGRPLALDDVQAAADRIERTLARA